MSLPDEEEALSNQLLSNLDELMHFFENAEERSIGDIQRKIILQNLLHNFTESADQYLDTKIANIDRFQSVIIQTTAVLRDAYSRLPNVGPISYVKKELQTIANQWIVKIIVTKSEQNFIALATSSHIIGEFLNDNHSKSTLVEALSPPQLGEPNYTTYYMIEFNYIFYLAYCYFQVMTKVKLLPRNWILSWSDQFFTVLSVASDFESKANYITLYSNDTKTASNLVFQSIDLYVQLSIFSYHLVAKLGNNWAKMVDLKKFTIKGDIEALVDIFEFSIDKISSLVDRVEELLDQYRDTISDHVFITNLSYVKLIIDLLDTIKSSIFTINRLINQPLPRFTSDDKLQLDNVKKTLDAILALETNKPHLYTLLEIEVVMLEEILLSQYLSLLFYKYKDPLQTLTIEEFQSQSDEIPLYLVNLRCKVYYIVYLFALTSYFGNIGIEEISLQLQSKYLVSIDNPFDKLSVSIIGLILRASYSVDEGFNLSSMLQEFGDLLRTLPLIHHLRSELETYLLIFKSEMKQVDRKPSLLGKEKVVSDPFTFILPGDHGHSEIPYYPFNTEKDFILPNEQVI